VVAVTDPEVREALAEAALSQPHVTQAPLVLVVCSNYVRSMSRYRSAGSSTVSRMPRSRART